MQTGISLWTRGLCSVFEICILVSQMTICKKQTRAIRILANKEYAMFYVQCMLRCKGKPESKLRLHLSLHSGEKERKCNRLLSSGSRFRPTSARYTPRECALQYNALIMQRACGKEPKGTLGRCLQESSRVRAQRSTEITVLLV